MVYEVRLSEESEVDLDLIFEHLVEAYIQLGEAPEKAFAQAGTRIVRTVDDIFSLGRAPHQGTL